MVLLAKFLVSILTVYDFSMYTLTWQINENMVKHGAGELVCNRLRGFINWSDPI
jgi:hypothetical protein